MSTRGGQQSLDLSGIEHVDPYPHIGEKTRREFDFLSSIGLFVRAGIKTPEHNGQLRVYWIGVRLLEDAYTIAYGMNPDFEAAVNAAVVEVRRHIADMVREYLTDKPEPPEGA